MPSVHLEAFWPLMLRSFMPYTYMYIQVTGPNKHVTAPPKNEGSFHEDEFYKLCSFVCNLVLFEWYLLVLVNLCSCVTMFRCDTGDHLLLSLPFAGGFANYKRAFFFNIPQKQHFFTMEIKEFFFVKIQTKK